MIFKPVDNTLSLIPQRPPFVMIDALTASDERLTRSSFRVKANNIFVSNGRLLEAALVENIAQTAAARAGYGSLIENRPVAIGYIGAVSNLVVRWLPEVHDELETEIIVINQVFNVTMIKGTIYCNHQLVADCEMKIFITPTNK